ncbi:MAG: hypothetical protein J6Z33_07170 [Lachnospiraceae bacterium]|nr:hypothetical protein [Lachnospiraceae bacterium]
MRRFWILLKKELIYGSMLMKIMAYSFAIGYSIFFGLFSRLTEAMFVIIFGLMPFIIAMCSAPQIVLSISSDKNERTGEMVLTTGVSLSTYVFSKLLSSIIHTILPVFLFDGIYLLAAGKLTAGALTLAGALSHVLVCIVANVFYCCISLMIRLTGFAKKLIILAFLLVAAAFLVLIMVNSFVAIPLMNAIPEIVLWPVLLVYGSICLFVGIKMLTVRDFIAK